MSLTEIEHLLHDAMGLNAASIGSSSVMRAVNERMTACNLSDIHSYKERLVNDRNELKELIEEVVVPETWFFRDSNPFKMLGKYVTEEWLPSEPSGPLRVLSLPCATGEEPYSIAISLIDAGLMPSQIRIDAFDISARNIKRCKEARYGNNSFRGVAPAIRDRFFSCRNGAYYPDILIKAMVNFGTASLLDPLFVNTCQPYDIVFCRNLLIYFDQATQQQAATMLYKLLNPNGVLFVGHAETGVFLGKCHVSQRYPKAFALRRNRELSDRANKISRTDLKSNTRTSNRLATKHKPAVRYTARPVTMTTLQTSAKSIPSHVRPPDLAEAKKLADCGRLAEAESICIQQIEYDKQNEQAYYLLALIQIASGDNQKAVQYLKNVIYLDPKNHDALMYLATLTAENGDETAAARYRERAQRIKQRGTAQRAES